jgi:pimeloyl-ACP methyl ester carboxylesterase
VELISCHTQVIGGGQDRIAGVKDVRALADVLPSGMATFEEISEAGHLVPFETPDMWRQRLLAFLDADLE